MNLRAKKYCIFNEQYSKEEYEKRVVAMNFQAWSGFSTARKQTKEFWLAFPNKCIQGVQNTNVSGEYITHSKNIKKSYLIRESEDLAYVQYSQVPSSRDCMDSTIIGAKAELFYECATSGWGSAHLKFCVECWSGGRELEYCIFCSRNAANLFGCVGILEHQYCILNKQYSKEDYIKLRERIIKHMNDMPYVDKRGKVYRYGEFLPPEFSPFAYNQTIAPEHFPLTKDEAMAFGCRWQDPNPSEYQTTMAAADIPDAVTDAKDDILKEVIQCSECKRAYRVIQPELQFLRQIKIPLPRSCVDCRHRARIAERNRSKIYPRQCGCAGTGSDNGVYENTASHRHGENHCEERFETSYPPDSPCIVYCEPCYQAEVV